MRCDQKAKIHQDHPGDKFHRDFLVEDVVECGDDESEDDGQEKEEPNRFFDISGKEEIDIHQIESSQEETEAHDDLQGGIYRRDRFFAVRAFRSEQKIGNNRDQILGS